MIERAMDLFAAEIGLDPVELRRRNLLRPEDFPYSAPTGITYDSGDYQRALALALDQVGYEDRRAEQAERGPGGDTRLPGIGVAVFVDRTAGVAGSEYGAVELRPDGTILVRTGSSPYGQGHHTAWAMIVADRTGLPLDRIEVVHGDTDVVPRGGVTGGSRSAQKAGSAVAEAADALVAAALGGGSPGAGGGGRGCGAHPVRTGAGSTWPGRLRSRSDGRTIAACRQAPTRWPASPISTGKGRHFRSERT